MEQMFLLTILRQPSPSSGYRIGKELNQAFDLHLTQGYIHATIGRLVKKQLIDKTPQGNRNFFTVTDKGEDALIESLKLSNKILSYAMALA